MLRFSSSLHPSAGRNTQAGAFVVSVGKHTSRFLEQKKRDARVSTRGCEWRGNSAAHHARGR
jgi:hypothetical protein